MGINYQAPVIIWTGAKLSVVHERRREKRSGKSSVFNCITFTVWWRAWCVLRDISEHAVFTSTCIVSGLMTWLVCSSGTKWAVLTSTCIVCRVWWRGWCVFQGQEPDNVHVYLYRLYGAMTCGLSCLPWVAPRFRTFANRRAVLFSKALVSTGITDFETFRLKASFSIRHQVSNQ